MAKAHPILRAFNSGIFSVLMEGRTDIDRYAAAVRQGFNYIGIQQGPALPRSGTEFRQPLRTEGQKGILVPFEFSKVQALMLEFSDTRVRFHDYDGLLTYDAVAVSSVVQTNPLKLDAPLLSAAVGDSVSLSGFPLPSNIENTVAKITAKVGTIYTFDTGYTGTAPSSGVTAALVYEVAHPYATEAELLKVRYIQNVDLVYLLTGGRMRTLARYGVYDWRFSEVKMQDGPYRPEDDKGIKLTPSGTGKALTSANSTASGGTTPINLLDDDVNTNWDSGAQQSGEFIVVPSAAVTPTGYWISCLARSANASYSAKDYAPGHWKLYGYDGSAWELLDEQVDYVLYDGRRSAYIELNNTKAYTQFKFTVVECYSNGAINCQLSGFAVASAASSTITLTASGTEGINSDEGFKSTDVGRLIRLRGNDNYWRWAEITAVTSATVVQVQLNGGPLPNTDAISTWRLGYWSDTTGWPTTGLFFDDRMWLSGAADAPDLVGWTATGAYTASGLTMSPTDPDGEQVADNGGCVRLNSAKIGAVQWMQTDERGLLLGTVNGEWVISQISSSTALSTTNMQARNSTKRGSAAVDALKIDRQVLFIKRGARAIYEMAYNYEADGYKAPWMSPYASNLFTKTAAIAQTAYCADPHSLVWIRRTDGTLVSMSYNRDEDVIGYYEHDVGGFVEWIASMAAPDDARDDLWMIVRRTINGQTRRYVERLSPFWDFGMTIDDAFFVDSGLRYQGEKATSIYGLSHLEGEEVMALVDGVPDGPFTVSGGKINLTEGGENVVVGKGFEGYGETSRIEAGAVDGTAQGKLKRVPSVVVLLWSSAGGEIGVYDEDSKEIKWEPIPYDEAPYSQLEVATLHTEEVEIPMEAGFGRRGTIFFRRPKESPLPFNIIRLCPSIMVQDSQ